MQMHTLKLNNRRKKRKTIGRGGKKGTYSGKGNKGQKARSGAHINPLFEGGRSTLIDHLKKSKGFKSIKPKKNVIKFSSLEKNFKNGDIINKEALVSAKLVDKKLVGNGIKILGGSEIKVKLMVDKNIFLSSSAKEAIEKAGGKIISEQGTVNKEQ